MASIRKLHQQLIQKERSAVEITQAALEHIQSLEPRLHSFLQITADHALTGGWQ
jgi:aspartyl-tRNA(Asn)/glutamyl-tRNA(Gln) amidotransferase subunit A